MLNGTLTVLADGANGVRLLDISNPTAPAEVGSFDSPDAAYAIDVTAERIYVADRLGGLFILGR